MRMAIPKPSDIDDQVFWFVVAFKRMHDGCSPTLREIANATDVSSTSHARFVLNRLHRQRRIVLGEGSRSRMIQVHGGVWCYKGEE